MARLLISILSVLIVALSPSYAVAASTGTKPTRVMFVCEHGYAKSMVAAHLFERLAAKRGANVVAVSRGIAPESPVPPALVANMARDGFDVSGFQPTKLTAADLRRADRVVVFNVDLPGPGNKKAERWDVPALSDGYPAARDAIVARLEALLDRLSSSRKH